MRRFFDRKFHRDRERRFWSCRTDFMLTCRQKMVLWEFLGYHGEIERVSQGVSTGMYVIGPGKALPIFKF